MPYKAGEPVVLVFRIVNPTSGLTETGVAPIDITSFIFMNGVVPAPVPSLTFSEISNGFYSVEFIPNTSGWWHLSIHHNTWNVSVFDKNFKCLNSNIDDVAVLVPSGTAPITVIVKDPSLNPISNTSISMWNDGHTVLFGIVETDVYGIASFTVVPGDYEIWPYKAMYDFTGTPYTFTAVAGTPQDVNITANPQFIRRPTRSGFCIVWGYLSDIMGKPIVGTAVEAIRENSALLTPEGDGLGNKVARTFTNVQGYFELELMQNQLLTVRVPGQNHQKKFIVPVQSNINFFSITQESPP